MNSTSSAFTLPFRFRSSHLLKCLYIDIRTPSLSATSMEYILCQENTNKAPLVLSEFLGTANSFTSALLINPHDVLGVAEAINQGLTVRVLLHL
jgi:trehalose-6-phosphate synthase